MVLLALESDGTRTRLGLSVPRKAGSAVERNRIKRRLREIFRRSPALHAGSQDLCLILRSEAARATSRELARELAVLVEKARSRVRRSDF